MYLSRTSSSPDDPGLCCRSAQATRPRRRWTCPAAARSLVTWQFSQVIYSITLSIVCHLCRKTAVENRATVLWKKQSYCTLDVENRATVLHAVADISQACYAAEDGDVAKTAPMPPVDTHHVHCVVLNHGAKHSTLPAAILPGPAASPTTLPPPLPHTWALSGPRQRLQPTAAQATSMGA